MDVILALNTALKARKKSSVSEPRMNLEYEWSVECVPHAILKDTNFASENIIVQLGEIRGY